MKTAKPTPKFPSPLLEKSLMVHQEWCDTEKCAVGKDPRNLGEPELIELGCSKQPLLSVIRAKCIDCCAGNAAEVRRCGMIDCPLWPYRMGTNPFHRQDLTPEQRAARGERLRNARIA